MAKRNILNTPIPDIKTPWDDGNNAYSGQAVEEFIKAQLQTKQGSLYFDDSEDSFITVYMFRNDDDKTAWLLDRDNDTLIMAKQTIRVANRKGEGTAFIVNLVGKNTAEPKFVNSKELVIPMKFTCRKSTTVAGNTTTEDLAGISGTVVVVGRRSGTSGSFTTITPNDGAVRYMDAVPADSETYRDFDLGPYLQDGECNYRITVIEPEKQTVSSAVSLNVTLSESMGLEYAGELGHPFSGESVSLPFYVKGSVDRLLHIQILDSTGKKVLATPQPYAFGSTQGGSETVQNIVISRSQFKFVHGTYNIKAWLTFASDVNGNPVSEQNFGVMYREDGKEEVLVAVADAISKADNYDTVTLLRYAVYNPSGEDYDLTLTIADGDNGSKIYHQEVATCENGKSYDFRTALNCEHDLGDFGVLVTLVNGRNTYYSGSVKLTNSIDFSTRGVPDLLLDPNTKSFYGTDKIGNSFVFNAKTFQFNDPVASNRTNILNPTIEGYVTENNQEMFRLLKGSKLELPFDAITSNTGLKVQGADHSVTMEFDIRVNNIQDESSPVISCAVDNSNSFIGMRILPNRVLVLGTGQGPISTPDMADYYIEEGRRIHIAINIVNNLRNEGLNYMRIYADGVMQREYTYANSSLSPFCDASGTNGHLLIGSDGCDVDLFGIRIMLDQSMSSTDIQQDYKASMPDIAAKRAFVAANDDILSGGLIDFDKAKEKYNTILYKIPGNFRFPTFNSDPGTIYNVVMEVRIIGDDKHSGVFSSCEMKRQGSTAKKYYWPNISTKLCKTDAEKGSVKGTFTSFGKDPETAQPYYNGTSYYQLDDSQPKSKKWVGKANYASSMQSHKIGCTAAFHDLHRLCALPKGGFAYDQAHPKTPSRRAVKELPFLCFYTDADHSTPTFCGFQTWGAAKGDKPTFGMDDDSSSPSYTPDYVMLEGADNNVTLANFETPWIPDETKYDVDEESFCYDGAPNLDMDLGALNENVDESDPLYKQPTGGSLDTINNYFIPAFNMVYLHNPNLRAYHGDLNSLNQTYVNDKSLKAENRGDEVVLESNVHYWNADPSSKDYLNVYRMDYLNDEWVNAGLVTSSARDDRGYNKITTAVLNLKTQLGFGDNELFGMADEQKTDRLVELRVEHFKTQFPEWFDVSDALFHQCFIKLVAGTDNRAKNTYYWIEGNIDHKIRFDGDDLDTVFKTDNKGQQSKKYWILEEDKDEFGAWFWNGRDNALFRLIEMAYEDDMRTMMNRMFAAMTTLAGSVDGFFQKYFYYVQEYYPAVAYNETARLLYETAQLYYDGIHPSEPGKSYGYKEMPITQSLGNQIHAEREYMSKRLALMMSYANYGDFALNGTDSITFTSTGSSTYNIKWTAYQDIFPVAAFGQALDYGTDEYGVKHTKPWRLKAGHTYTISTQMSGETTVAIHGMSYCAEIGNLGANAIKGNLRLTGKRLRQLVMPRKSEQFVPASIMLASNMNLEVIDWKGIDFSNSHPSFDFTSMKSLQRLDLAGCTGVIGVDVPTTASLEFIALPSGLGRLELVDIVGLKEFTIDGVEDLRIVRVENTPANTKNLVAEIYDKKPDIVSLVLKGVNWDTASGPMVAWLANIGAELTGRIDIAASSRIGFDDKVKLVEMYGNIDNEDNPLYVTYTTRALEYFSISGNFYFGTSGEYPMKLVPSSAQANDFTAIDWALDDNPYASIDQKSGVVTVKAVGSEDIAPTGNLTVTVHKLDGTTLIEQVEVGFYGRSARLGDYVYADGSYGDILDKGKTPIGICFYTDPSDRLRRLAVALSQSSTGYQWGLYSHSNKSYGFTKSDIQLADHQGYNVFDIATLPNVTRASSVTINDDNLVDEVSGDADGWKVHEYNTQFGHMGWVTLTEPLGNFKAGDSIPTGLLETLRIIEHRNLILEDSAINLPLPRASEGKTMYDNVVELINKVISENTGTYQQFYYPPASLCNAYQPIGLKEGETLSPKFKQGNWFLPSSGEQARYLYFIKQGKNVGVKKAIFAKAFTEKVFNWPSGQEYASTEMTGDNIYVASNITDASAIAESTTSKMHAYGCRPVVMF